MTIDKCEEKIHCDDCEPENMKKNPNCQFVSEENVQSEEKNVTNDSADKLQGR